MPTPILGTPSAYQITRNFFLAECPARSWPTNITQQVPDPLPTGRRFWTLERLNTASPSRFVSAQLLQLRYYDPDGKRAEQIADQAAELWKMLPSADPSGPVHDVEIIGGPAPHQDPDRPDLQYYFITAWVEVMKTQFS